MIKKIITTERARRIVSLQAQISLPAALRQEQETLLKRLANDYPMKRDLDPSILIESIWVGLNATDSFLEQVKCGGVSYKPLLRERDFNAT